MIKIKDAIKEALETYESGRDRTFTNKRRMLEWNKDCLKFLEGKSSLESTSVPLWVVRNYVELMLWVNELYEDLPE